jgi:hypothetical protein
MSYKVAYP